MKKKLIVLGVLAVIAVAVGLIPVGGIDETRVGSTEGGPMMDLSEFSAEPPGETLRVLFIHHSTGGQLLADQGPMSGDLRPHSIHDSHPNGGGLRARLQAAGYEVHEASYGSEVGADTDMFHWLPKFRDQMERVLRTDLLDTQHPEGVTNDVVMFKSCFPNSNFVGEGDEPGDPNGPDLTVWNARATLTALLDHFGEHPNVLFVYFTAPPLAGPTSQPLWKWLAKSILRRGTNVEQQYRAARLARQFNNWVRSPDGWLRDYPHRNVVVFPYYDVLTNHGESNFLLYPTGDGHDSHPSSVGQQRAAEELVPLLNRAVRRAGLIDGEVALDDAERADAGVAAGVDGGVDGATGDTDVGAP